MKKKQTEQERLNEIIMSKEFQKLSEEADKALEENTHDIHHLNVQSFRVRKFLINVYEDDTIIVVNNETGQNFEVEFWETEKEIAVFKEESELGNILKNLPDIKNKTI